MGMLQRSAPMVLPSLTGMLAPTSAPTNLLLLYQGETGFNSSNWPYNGAGTGSAPSYPNQQTIGWTSVSGATSYDIYRSTDGVTYTYYDNNGSTTPTYTDLGATDCCGSSAGSGSQPFQYFPATTYWYKVAARNAAGAGPLSLDMSFMIFQGQFWSNSVNTAGSGATINLTATPTIAAGNLEWAGSNNYNFEMSITSAYGLVLVYAGASCPTYNLWIGAFNYLEFDIITSAASPALSIWAEKSNDAFCFSNTGAQQLVSIAPYVTSGSFTQNTVCHIKMPLSAYMEDYGPSGGSTSVLQQDYYKFGLQDQTGTTGYNVIMNNVAFTH